MQILASAANGALTTTVWAPVYVAAATVMPAAVVVAAAILAVHVVGLPLAIFVVIRTMTEAFDTLRLLRRRGRAAKAADVGGEPDRLAGTAQAQAQANVHAKAVPPRRRVARRSDFGLRLLLRR
jgi:hypothetical protein